MTFNKIFNFENNIKLTNELKTNYIYDLLNFSKINISSETSIQKSISFLINKIKNIVISHQVLVQFQNYSK